MTKFEHSAAVTQSIDIPNHTPANFIQFLAENVDHNIQTIDGNSTFHGMGMIPMVTPGTSTTRRIPCAPVTAEDTAAVNIEHFISEFAHLHAGTFVHLQKHDVEDVTANGDLLWNITLSLPSPQPAWPGMRQMVQAVEHQSTISGTGPSIQKSTQHKNGCNNCWREYHSLSVQWTTR